MKNRRTFLKGVALFAAIPFVNTMTNHSTLLAAGAKKFSKDLVLNGEVITAAHWGALKVTLKDGKIIESTNAFSGLTKNPLQEVVADCVDGKRTNRIKAPMVRKSYLEKKPNHKALRGADEWVEVSYKEAFKLANDAIKKVRKERGASGIFGGSYGWKSSGNLHSARTLLHRYLTMGGGFVGGIGDYSTGAAQVILPHVIGTLEVYEQQTSYPVVLEHSKVIVIWGANPIDTLKIAWSATDNAGLEFFKKLKESGKKIICIDPVRSNTIEFFGDKAEWVQLVPNTDSALLLGIMHTLLSSKQYDKEFLENYTEGFDKFESYLLGKEDKIVKNAKWASKICGVKEKVIKDLAKTFYTNRTLIMGGWAIQRQHHGEQGHWLLVTLASMLGQIGLSGGGFGFSYHYSNGGSPTTSAPVVGGITVGSASGGGQEWLSDGSSEAIPVARVADMLLNPGKTIDHNGGKITYPKIDLIYWVGGNPFVHHQDTNTLLKAWREPECVIVNEIYWTPTAKMADIVFPVNTSYEKNDITMSGDYSNLHIIPMKQVVKPLNDTKSDFEVFAELAKLGGFGKKFSEGKSELQWLESFYNQARDRFIKAGGYMANGDTMPEFKDFWADNKVLEFAPTIEGEAFVKFADFREDPILNPLGTPSGKIEIYSETIDKMGYADCRGIPMWYEPIEWLGMKNKPAEFALVCAHPALRLHSQLNNTSLRERYAVSDREPVWINPKDAKKKGIKDGDLVRIFNARGQIVAGAVVSDIVPSSVIRVYEGAWWDPEDVLKENSICKNGNANVLTIDIPSSPLANGNIAETALVNIEKYQGEVLTLSAFNPPKGAK
ncbi:MAG: molybdopterin guanine dinucleotide-containing S/N-oxide reductase [Helicobacter sp.]|nr:molybdopterin guanine dinucleotide-containing S/N-oxide reductase [Helicobacter sp.]